LPSASIFSANSAFLRYNAFAIRARKYVNLACYPINKSAAFHFLRPSALRYAPIFVNYSL
jgi:hypothetical protein